MLLGKSLVLTIFESRLEIVTAFCCLKVISCFLHTSHEQFVTRNLGVRCFLVNIEVGTPLASGLCPNGHCRQLFVSGILIIGFG